MLFRSPCSGTFAPSLMRPLLHSRGGGHPDGFSCRPPSACASSTTPGVGGSVDAASRGVFDLVLYRHRGGGWSLTTPVGGWWRGGGRRGRPCRVGGRGLTEFSIRELKEDSRGGGGEARHGPSGTRSTAAALVLLVDEARLRSSACIFADAPGNNTMQEQRVVY